MRARRGSARSWCRAVTTAARSASAGTGRRTSPCPIAADVGKASALRILEQPEDYPAVIAQQQSVRSYPRPFGINLAHVLGYLSPITSDEYDVAHRGRRRLAQRRLGRGPRGGRAGVRPVAARHARLPHRRRRLDGPGARRRRRGGRPARRHPRHLDRREGAGHRRAPARRHDQDRPGDPRRRDRPQLRRRLGCRGGDGGRHRPGRRDGQPADVRPLGLGGRDQQEAAQRAVLRARPATRCSAGRRRASSRRARRGSRSTR